MISRMALSSKYRHQEQGLLDTLQIILEFCGVQSITGLEVSRIELPVLNVHTWEDIDGSDYVLG